MVAVADRVAFISFIRHNNDEVPYTVDHTTLAVFYGRVVLTVLTLSWRLPTPSEYHTNASLSLDSVKNDGDEPVPILQLKNNNSLSFSSQEEHRLSGTMWIAQKTICDCPDCKSPSINRC